MILYRSDFTHSLSQLLTQSILQHSTVCRHVTEYGMDWQSYWACLGSVDAATNGSRTVIARFLFLSN